MAYVLTTSSRITCATQGSLTAVSSRKLKVSGSAVLCSSDVNGKLIVGCTNSSSNTVPCKTVSSVSGTSLKLKASGEPVVLNSSNIGTDGTDSTMSATANQTKLKG